MADPAKDYKVGYGKPPCKHQFKPGQSGNPAGGKKPAKTLQQMVLEEGAQLIKVNKAGVQVKMTKAQAVVTQLFASAMKGDHRAQKLAMELFGSAQASQVGGDSEEMSDEQYNHLLALMREQQEGDSV